MVGAGVVEGYVRSADGTGVGLLSQGSGPGMVLVQGAMGTAEDYGELAEALAPHFTVHALDRRGRGLSPRHYDTGHTIDRDVEDVDAVLAATSAGRVFGLSSGAVIALEAAKMLPRVTRAAVYEPPFYATGFPTTASGSSTPTSTEVTWRRRSSGLSSSPRQRQRRSGFFPLRSLGCSLVRCCWSTITSPAHLPSWWTFSQVSATTSTSSAAWTAR